MKKSAINRQRGSIILPFVVSLLVGLILLGGVQIGYYFFMKRELQNTVDLAVLSGVQLLIDEETGQADCSRAENAVWASAKENFEVNGNLSKDQITVNCGVWREDLSGEKHFRSIVPSDPRADTEAKDYDETEHKKWEDASPNALHVTIKYNSSPFMPFSSAAEIAVEAIAKTSRPVAAFQVGSQLLNLDNTGLLGRLLSTLGLNPDHLTVLDKNGLADVKISPSGLLDLLQLPVGFDKLSLLSPDGVAELQDLTLINILDASVKVITEDPVAVELAALRQGLIDVGLGSIKVPLGSWNDKTGLFAFLGAGKKSPPDSALDVELGLGDILKTAIAIGANGHAIAIPTLKLLGGVEAQLYVVSPPTIAIGPIGTTAHNAQIRLWLDIDTKKIPLVGVALDNLGVRIHLPIAIDITSGTGELTGLQCTSSPRTIDVAVDSSILNVCIGHMTESNIMSNKNICQEFLSNEELLKLKPLGLFNIELNSNFSSTALPSSEELLGLTVGEDPARSTKGNDLKLGTTVNNLVTGILNTLSDGLGGATPPSPSDTRGELVRFYLKESKDSLGMYDVDKVTDWVLNGYKDEEGNQILPKVLTNNFTFDKAIPTTCGVLVCSPDNLITPWKKGTFKDAFHEYTSVPYSLLSLVGLPWMGNNFQNCAGLLSSLLNWNNCVEHNLTELMKQYPSYVEPIYPDEVGLLLDGNVQSFDCNGILCALLKPVLTPLQILLDGLGEFLSTILNGMLGLELGKTEVKALAIDCDPAQLVY